MNAVLLISSLVVAAFAPDVIATARTRLTRKRTP